MIDKVIFEKYKGSPEIETAIKFGVIVGKFDKEYADAHVGNSFLHDLDSRQLFQLFQKAGRFSLTDFDNSEFMPYSFARSAEKYIGMVQDLIDDNGCKQCVRCRSILPEKEMYHNKENDTWVCNSCKEES